MTNENIPALQYQRSPAKYAKGKVALHVPGIGGFKSIAGSILTNEILTRNTFSNRERAYIVSPAQADRFESAVEAVRVRWETPVLEDNFAIIISDDIEPHAADCPYRHCGECLCGVALINGGRS